MKKYLWMKIPPVLFFVCYVASFATAQRTYLTLSGQVTDSETGKSVPFASIQIAGLSTGTSSNAEGRFIFKVPDSYQNDSLKISCTGYQSVTQVITGNTSGVLRISLKPATVELDEVLVQSGRKTAVDIFKDAVAAIPRNYDTSAVQLMAFYREAARLDDYEIAFDEAVLGVYQPPYTDTKAENQIKVLKERKKQFDHSKDPRFYGWIRLNSGAKNALEGNNFRKHYQKPHKYSILNEKNFKHYVFTLDKIIKDGDRNEYVINIKPRKKSRKAYARGKFYIDVQTLAFTKWEWVLTQAGLDRENNDKILLRKIAYAIMKANLKLSDIKETATFSLHNDKWYLNTVQRNFQAIVNSKKRNIENGLWQTNLIVAVTDIETEHPQPFSEGTVSNNDTSDTAFWEHYNIIQPTTADTTGNWAETDTATSSKQINQAAPLKLSNRQNGFTRADTLRGKLTPLRTCYDVSFYHLDVKVDIANKSISGSNQMRFRVVEPFNQMQVDLYANMQIHRIVYGKKELPFTREYNAVFVQFPESLKPGTEQSITIHYSGKPQVPDFSLPMHGGFLWDKDATSNPWVQVVCQGSGASVWWPNKDHLSDEPDSMKISVTVPDGLMNISNGRLLAKTPLPDNWTKYDWQVSYPINNYNVTLNIGKYAHWRDTYVTNNDTLTLDHYAMPYNLEKARMLFAGIKPMLVCLENYYGKYPFGRDGFTVMESLYPMEHQSAVSVGKLPEGTVTDSLDLPASLMWHEVSHEWWGNNVSCKDIADMWIHEAFATYTEGLQLKAGFGEEGELGYMQGLPEQVIGNEPIIGVSDVNHIHYDIGDMYSKGALMLHTFKHVLNNDTLWRSILYGIQQDFKYQTVTTADIVQYINEKTKTDYAYFFDQYLKFPSLPTLLVKLTVKGERLTVQYKWKADVPDFRMPVKVTQAPNEFDFIYPTTAWQTITLPNLEPDDFAVDEDRFYVNVEVEE